MVRTEEETYDGEPAEEERMSRRDFFGFFKLTALTAIPLLGAGATAHGGLVVWKAEQDATALHPNERKVDNELGTIISDLESAKRALVYTPERYETHTHFRRTDTDGDGDTDSSVPYSESHYYPPNYPEPSYAKGRINVARSSFGRIAELVKQENTIDDMLLSVDEGLPNVERETVSSDKYVWERSKLQDAINWCRQYKNKNSEVLYAEVAPKRNIGFLELILGPVGIIGGTILYWIYGRRQNDEE